MLCDIGFSDTSVCCFEQLMSRYQQADATAVRLLIERLSPQLFRFFADQMGCETDAEDMLRNLWLRIHQARHTYRPGEPVLPWVYAIARCVRTDSYRQRRRVASREITAAVLPEASAQRGGASQLQFQDLVASLSEGQRVVLTIPKLEALTVEEVARAAASTIGAVKQVAHRAYERLRRVLEYNRRKRLYARVGIASTAECSPRAVTAPDSATNLIVKSDEIDRSQRSRS